VAGAPAFTVVLPTYNERASLSALHPRLSEALRSPPGEVLVVDDSSPDGTAELVEEFQRAGPFRVLRRATRMGLASAVIEGIAHARTDVIAVMDADGSHPPESIPNLVGPVLTGRAQFVLASRHLPGASSDGLSGSRRVISRGAQILARPLTRVTDPMSGFFAFDRRVLAGASLSPVGYKIALEILVRCRPRPVVEIPYVFAPRLAGESKLGGDQLGEYLRHLGRLYAFRVFGPRTAASTR
jgi:glycosyltransferase involved in cell wall biosynthesis